MTGGVEKFQWEDAPLDEFERKVLEGARRVAADEGNPIRGNLYAAAIRELLGHLMDRLAPEQEVRACWWFEQASDTDGITRRQRAQYMTQGGLPKDMIDGIGIDLGPLQGAIVKAIGGLHKIAHVRPGTVLHDAQEIELLDAGIVSGLNALFGALAVCREAVVEAVADEVDAPATYALADETLADIDILASHHAIDWIEPGEIRVAEIRSREVVLEVTGRLGVELQWGSGGDRRRGDAATMNEVFPWTVTMTAPIGSLAKLTVIDRTVDTESWYGPSDGAEDDNSEEQSQEV